MGKSSEGNPRREDWRPIESAPKDGRFIFLCEPKWNAGAVVGKWFDFGKEIHGEHGFWEAHATQVYPTGWMPIPANPWSDDEVTDGGATSSCGPEANTKEPTSDL